LAITGHGADVKSGILGSTRPAPSGIAALGERCGVSVNGINAIILLDSILQGTDYWRKSPTLEKLGGNDLSLGEPIRQVTKGNWGF